MKKIYKVLISILIISMLTVVAISAVTGPYTGCVSKSATKYDIKGIFYYFQSGSTPTNPCKIGDDQITIYEKTYIDGIVNSLQNQINSLMDRTTNLENNQYTYIAGDYRNLNFTPTSPMKTVATYSFYLPVDSYVYAQSSGSLSTDQPIDIAMGVDNRPCGDYWCYIDKLRGMPVSWFSGFEISNAGYLGKGYHMLYFDAGWSSSTFANVNLHFSVMSTQRTLSTSTTSAGSTSNGISTNENIHKAIYKDGKVTIE